MYRILIVEDDATIAGAMQRELSGWGYEVECVSDFESVLEHFRRFAPQLVLLDLALPHRGGYHWCAEIRKESQVPVIFVSSSGDNMSLVTAIHQGGDDFIPKPFDLPVLTAKVQALLRRSYDFAKESPSLSHRGTQLLPGEACLLLPRGDKLDLTRNELRILELLFERKGRIVPRDDLVRRLWEDESYIDDNTLTVNVNRLRKKLDEAGLADYIETRKGLGYLISGE